MKMFNDLVHKSRAEPLVPVREQMQGTFEIRKSDDDRMQAFGWANVAFSEDGSQISDFQKDMIDAEDLENASYEFVKYYRDGSEMHQQHGVATLIESMFFSKEKQSALGIPEGTMPEGWWVGFQVTDPDVWGKIKDGTYKMFSIEGTADRVPVPEEGGDL